MARGPWLQEQLTHYIADRFYDEVGAVGVIVRTVCTHTCAMLDLDSGEVPRLTLCALRGSFAMAALSSTPWAGN
jgi:GTP cyclohydrolase I